MLHEGVAMSFQTIANASIEYPAWFSEGKTILLPKPREFNSDNPEPDHLFLNLYKVFKNTLYNWFTL